MIKSDYEKTDVSFYGIWNTTFNDKLAADFGIRYDYNFINAQKYYKTSRWEERGYNQDFSDFVVNDLGTQLLTNPTFTYHNISLSAGIIYNINKNNNLKSPNSIRAAEWCNPSLNNSDAFGGLDDKP